jgi:predicted enzyme related to lactoylglutathione lyase
MTPLPSPAVVLFVENISRVAEFYRSVADMALVLEDDHHALLELPNFQLVVHGLPGGASAPSLFAVEIREDSYVKFSLPVADIAAARTKAAEAGGCVYPPEKEWEARNIRACDGYDPEGNVFQVRQVA